jgi:hypothetical protein
LFRSYLTFFRNFSDSGAAFYQNGERVQRRILSREFDKIVLRSGTLRNNCASEFSDPEKVGPIMHHEWPAESPRHSRASEPGSEQP